MIASQAFCCASLILPHIRPARWNPAGGRFDQRCFCAVLLQSNSPVLFSVSFSVATKAFAAATIVGVVFCAVVDPTVVVGPVATLVGMAPLVAAAPVLAVAAVVAAGALVANAVGCCAAGGTAVTVVLDDPAPH